MADNVALAAELLVATSGLWPEKPLGPGSANDAKALPKAWAGQIADLLAPGSRPTKSRKSPVIPYLPTWAKLNTRRTREDQVASAAINDPQISAAYQNKLVDARLYLHDSWHPLKLQTIVGPKLLEPATSELERCSDLYALVSDPSRMLDSLRAGSVLQADVDAIQTVYPEIYGLLSDLISGELLRQKARRKSYEPPYYAELAVQVFLGIPQGNPVEAVSTDQTSQTPEEPPQVDIKIDKPDLGTKAEKVADLGTGT